jgi:hypothetical protein
MGQKALTAVILMDSASRILAGLLANGDGNRRGISDDKLVELSFSMASKLAGLVASAVGKEEPAESGGKEE